MKTIDVQKYVTVFNFNQSQIRTVIKEGEPWFVAKDVCDISEITKYRDAIATLDVDERELVVVDTLGGNQRMSVVSESGLYALVFKSRKPQVQVFRKRVTSEVLPAVRKTGHRLLAAKGLQIKESDQWIPTEKGRAFSVLLDTGKRHTNGCMIQQLKWKESVLKEFELL